MVEPIKNFSNYKTDQLQIFKVQTIKTKSNNLVKLLRPNNNLTKFILSSWIWDLFGYFYGFGLKSRYNVSPCFIHTVCVYILIIYLNLYILINLILKNIKTFVFKIILMVALRHFIFVVIINESWFEDLRIQWEMVYRA